MLQNYVAYYLCRPHHFFVSRRNKHFWTLLKCDVKCDTDRMMKAVKKLLLTKLMKKSSNKMRNLKNINIIKKIYNIFKGTSISTMLGWIIKKFIFVIKAWSYWNVKKTLEWWQFKKIIFSRLKRALNRKANYRTFSIFKKRMLNLALSREKLENYLLQLTFCSYIFRLYCTIFVFLWSIWEVFYFFRSSREYSLVDILNLKIRQLETQVICIFQLVH